MDRISLKAEERELLGKKVRKLRQAGLVPAHVYGKKIDSEHVAVNGKEFAKTLEQAGETGLINLRISDEKVRPVMVRGLQYQALTGELLHIDFYQVNLKEKVTVPVPIVLIGEEPESVHLGESVVLQTLSEVQVEALPGDLIEKFEVDITPLQEIGQAILIKDLTYDHEKLTLHADEEETIVKLDTAVTEEMKRLMEEQAAEAQAAAATVEGETEEEKAAGETPEGEAGESAEDQKTEANSEEQPQ